MSKVTIPALHEMKRSGEKIFGVVAWDTHMAAIADRVGVEIVSVGDTVGQNMWGHHNPLEITMDEMITVSRAVRNGVKAALVSADFPYGPLQEGADAAVRAAIRFVKDAVAYEEIAFASVPLWLTASILPIAFGLLCVRYFLLSGFHLRRSLAGEMDE